VTHQGAACDAASIHFGRIMRRTDIVVYHEVVIFFVPGRGTFTRAPCDNNVPARRGQEIVRKDETNDG